MGFIYTLTSPSGKSYVGQTTRPIEDRFDEHQKPSSCVAIYRAIDKHGWDNFITDYYECPDSELNKHETWLIRLMVTLAPNGYNLREGGSNGKMSEEAKKKLSEAQTGKILSEEHKKKLSEANIGKTHTEETRKKLREVLSGENHPNFGKRVINKTNNKIRRTKNILSEETRKKISKAHMGKKHTVGSKKKMSEAKSGELNVSSKKVYQYDLQGNYIRWFGSCREVGRLLNINSGHISSCATGKRKSIGGFKWTYIPPAIVEAQATTGAEGTETEAVNLLPRDDK
ncbi:GIY-YIG catalytic domain-containing endonuclease [Only Syngen Nebraska virus 5]|uniref:GIY-YIG catalytic domain-containing endonuclease n=1 Tax=Only Syngen Nebraska virus 5 TaxID=1917232 RepID=UPI0009009CAC|nr:GIY-YIG catalytic domain-containing endonuclease [Only Syngen Nebraska virus 5]APC25684.1 GIY-YIG catalytic domain-containing endonuclease [Only Syngen Nebraska virus 5]